MVVNLHYYIYNYSILLGWVFYTYFIGIYINYAKLNIFDTHILLTITSIYGIIDGAILIIFDKDHPYEILKKLKMINNIDKVKILISCLPINKIHVFAYIDSDPILITIFRCIGIILNLFITAIYNKKYYLLDKLNIISSIINVVFCLIPFVLNDNLTIKLNNNFKFGTIGIITSILSLLLTCVCNIYSENIKLIENLDIINNCNTLTIFTFFIIEVILYILFTPIIYYIQIYLTGNIVYDLDKIYYLLAIGGIFALIYGPIYVISTKSYLLVSAIDNGIIRNICLILTAIISCLIGMSKFYYLYIPCIIFISVSSFILIRNTNKLNNKNNKNITNSIDNEFTLDIIEI